jgi:catechol 2,3-dioxygenase
MSDVGVRPPGFRLPADIRIGRVRLQVADLDRSVTWYRDAMGFALLSHDGARAALGGDTVILEVHEQPGVRPVPHRGRLGLYHFAVLLPSRGDLGRFLRAQAERGTRFSAADHAFSEALYLVDPDGITMEVYADRPRSEWAVRDRQYVGVTEPLDSAAVVAAAGTARWAGMPAGTALGHVHLYVGALGIASSFYHDGLGFDRVIWSYPGALFVSAGGYHHHVGLNVWAAGAPRATAGDARMIDWELVVPDTATQLGALHSIGAAGFAAWRDARTADGAYDAAPGGHPADAAGDVVADDPWGSRVRIVSC